MKVVVAFAICVGLVSCQTPQATTAVGSAEPANEVTDGWQPGERRVIAPPSSVPQLQIGPYRRGSTPDGLPYRYYADGSGSVAFSDEVLSGWSFDCKSDAMSDTRLCTVSSSKARLMLTWQNGKPSGTCVFSHDFPGRSAQIRIDSNPPITLPDSCLSTNISPQLVKGGWVTTRHYKWPSDIARDNGAALKGLASAIDLMKWLERSKPSVL